MLLRYSSGFSGVRFFKSIGTVDSFVAGYSLAFSSSATNGFIGNLKNFGLRKVLGDPSPGSPVSPAYIFKTKTSQIA
jgi:ammonia channel protein AmtB